jgi:hypothetical protein
MSLLSLFSPRDARMMVRSSRRRRRTRLCVEPLEDRAMPATLWVTNTDDNGGVNPAVGAGTGTLRQAILDADFQSTPTVIAFAIPTTDTGYDGTTGTFTIHLRAALANLDPGAGDNNPVTIDGTTQPGYAGKPLIELNGSEAGPGANGLRCDGDVRGGFYTVGRLS